MKQSQAKLAIIVFLSLILLSLSMIAKATTNTAINGSVIKGQVTNKKNSKALRNINILVVGTVLSSNTDITGHYNIKNVPLGKITIEARSTGYHTIKKEIISETNKTIEVNFTMEEDEVSLDEIVVSANRYQTLRRESPTIVNVMDKKMFVSTHSTNLAQGLNFTPGLRTEDNCANCGFSQVRINGLDGHYSQILIDSRPVFSALQGVYGLEQIPANMIERVEVVRGGGSALFGASAIGGTINIITKEPLNPSAEFAHTIMSIGNNSTFENNTTMNASVITENNKAGFYIYGQNKSRTGYDRDGDGYTDMPMLKNQVIGMNSFLRLNDYSRLQIRYHALKEYRRGGNKLDFPGHQANIAEELDHNINGGSFVYDLFASNNKHRFNAYLSFENIARKSYYGGLGEEGSEDYDKAARAYGKTHDLNIVGGTQWVYNIDKAFFMPSTLSAGLEYAFDNILDHNLGYGIIDKQKATISSLYAQNEWKNGHVGILIGGRIDKHNLVKHTIFSPRINFRYSPTRDINLRFTYAGGFRAPQVFDEDLHTSIADGEIYKTVLASNLKEERSYSFTLSADMYKNFGLIQTNFLIEGFYTRLNDVFAQRVLDQVTATGHIIKERYNANGANVFGINLEGKIAYTSLFSLQAGLTFQRSLYKEAQAWSDNEDVPAEKRMMRTPNIYGYFTATTTPIKKITLSLSGTYTGSMLTPHMVGSGVDKDIAVNTPKFFVLNCKLAYDFILHKQIKLEINSGIQNIFDSFQNDFDKGAKRDADYVYGPGLPRSIFAGIKISY